MKFHAITGGGGTRLNVAETGKPDGRSILYIHGMSQCWQSWSRQLNSELAQDFRLVAMDMRGHGHSEKPPQGYENSKLWADDVNAVITILELDRPVLCGWSYGPLLILDYIREFGENNIAGVHFVGAVTKLGSEEALGALTPELLEIFPGLLSTEANESAAGLAALLRLCFANRLSDEDHSRMLGYSVSVPSYVRQGLFSRAINNDDLLAKLKVPILISHGERDAVVKPSAAAHYKATFAPHAELHMMSGAGHACFWDDAPEFNLKQREFASA